METESKQAVRTALRKTGKTVWSALPWIGLAIWIACLIISPMLHASERGELKSQIAALEAKSAMQESENARLYAEIDWLRSQVEEADDGKTQ
jgi:hypothetical protein